jgi:hypothetical protein
MPKLEGLLDSRVGAAIRAIVASAVDPERTLKIDAMNGRYARKRSSAEGEGCVHQGDVVEEGDGDLMGDG